MIDREGKVKEEKKQRDLIWFDFRVDLLFLKEKKEERMKYNITSKISKQNTIHMFLSKLRNLICLWEIRLQEIRNKTRKNYEDVAASILTHPKQENNSIMTMMIMLMQVIMIEEKHLLMLDSLKLDSNKNQWCKVNSK